MDDITGTPALIPRVGLSGSDDQRRLEYCPMSDNVLQHTVGTYFPSRVSFSSFSTRITYQYELIR